MNVHAPEEASKINLLLQQINENHVGGKLHDGVLYVCTADCCGGEMKPPTPLPPGRRWDYESLIFKLDKV